MPELFTPEEYALLERFVTNTSGRVFVLRNLPEVVKGALFSRYSRSTKSLRRVLLDEFIQKPETGFKDIVGEITSGVEQAIAIKKAEEFYDRVLVGFGDDSVAELAGVHVALEGISNIATKFIEDARIGLSPLEKSTRYVYFDQKDENGKWLYYEEPMIMQSEFRESYVTTCNHLFETYSKLIPKISKYVEERSPREDGVSDRAYAAAIRAKTCDILRGLLPASTITNIGVYGNGRAFEYLLIKMYASPLAEIQRLARELEEELRKVIPSFIKRASSLHGKEMQDYIKSKNEAMEKLATSVLSNIAVKAPAQKEERVRLVWYDREAETKAVAHALYPYADCSLSELESAVRELDQSKKEEIINAYIGTRKNRRHKPYRAFENIYYVFDICANFGCYRDLHRHRILTQERQLLSCRHGYDTPKEIVESGYASEFSEAMETAKQCYDEIAKKMPQQAQYVVPFAYKIRWYITMNLREAYHMCELRSQRQGHPDYRKIVHEIAEEIKKVHPTLAKGMIFVDRADYDLERLEAEKKFDKKLEEIKKKYGESQTR
jgi:thymidylate synthase ThyX